LVALLLAYFLHRSFLVICKIDVLKKMSTDIQDIVKALLEYPFPDPTIDDNDNEKEKLRLRDDAELGLGGGGGGGGSDIGPTAALTPAIWDKTIPYDGETFHLEYMDLEEFLMENSIPTSLDGTTDKEAAEKMSEKKVSSSPGKTMKHKVATGAGSSSGAPVSLLPILELDGCEEEEVTLAFNNGNMTNGGVEETSNKDRVTPEPIDPEEVEVDVNFEPDPTDLVLSSVPGGELFNPRKHKFSVEELKPQPMIKKAKKVLVPEEQKDEKYWQRRKKNNVAAKRSRDARRLKENQITVRAAFLERENSALRQEVAELRKDFGRCKNVVACYEAKFGTLPPLEEE